MLTSLLFPRVARFALLYTNRAGQRRIRVHNLALPVVDNETEMFRYADVQATLNVLVKRAVSTIQKHGLVPVRNEVLNSTVNMLHMYRTYCTKTTSPAQLILPESLKLLPIYLSALFKCPVLRMNSGGQLDDLLRTDERVAEFAKWRCVGLPACDACLPQLSPCAHGGARVWADTGAWRWCTRARRCIRACFRCMTCPRRLAPTLSSGLTARREL